MQVVDLTQYSNKAGWEIHFDNTRMAYVLRDAKGVEKNGTYTQRRWAENALETYFKEMQATAPKNMAKAKKAEGVAA